MSDEVSLRRGSNGTTGIRGRGSSDFDIVKVRYSEERLIDKKNWTGEEQNEILCTEWLFIGYTGM